MFEKPRLSELNISGFRPFGEFKADLGALEVLVGANGAGKSSLFEFLKFLRDGMLGEIPPEIVAGSLGRAVFHVPGPDLIDWYMEVVSKATTLFYSGAVNGPVGRPVVLRETVGFDSGSVLMWTDEEDAIIRYVPDDDDIDMHLFPSLNNQLALGTITSKEFQTLFDLRKFISSWRFYSSFKLADEKIRKPVLIEQEPVLREDCGNLSAVLHYLMTEHHDAFIELQEHLRTVVPDFKGITVKARGGPGEVIAFWREGGVDDDLPIADLSDGIIRLICWMVLCLHPKPSPLICIDEPDQGVHPRTLPVLAGLFKKASERTQILLATHSSYFLTQFDISQIAVLRKENGEAKFIKPADSAVLKDSLEDFGPDEIEAMHRSDELERLP